MDLKGKRKLVAYTIAVVATIILALTGKLTGDNIESIFNTVIWAFVVGNGSEYATKHFGRNTE